MRDHIYNYFKGLVWRELISLSVLFEDGIDTIKHLINVIDKNKYAETTIDYLIHACNLKRNYYCKRTYLVEAEDDFATYIIKLAMENKDKASSEFVSYIMEREPENTYQNKYCEIDRSMACSQLYGYAALAKVLDLDDSPLKNHIKYPYRLAHYKREMKFYPEKMLDIPKLEYKKGIPEHPSLEQIIPYHFHESVNELIHDYRNMDDVNNFFKKHRWIYDVCRKDELLKMKKEDEKRTIGLLLIYLLTDERFIFVFEDEEDLEQAYLYKGMWPDIKTRGVYFDGIPENPSLEEIIPYHFHESVNELIHDYRNMDDVDKFFEKHWWIYDVCYTDEFLRMKKEDEEGTIGLLLIYLLTDERFIFVFEDEEDLEQAYLYKGMWPDIKTRGVYFDIPGSLYKGMWPDIKTRGVYFDIPGSQFYIAYIPASSKLKTFFGIKMIDIKDEKELEDYQEELKPFIS